MDNTKKNLLICMLENALAVMKSKAGITNMGELDTDVAALRTAYTTNPDSVTEADIDAVHDKMAAISSPELNSIKSVWTEADQG